MEALINLRKAAEVLGMSECSLYRKIERGELPHVRLGKTIRFKPSSLERYINERAVSDAAPDGLAEK